MEFPKQLMTIAELVPLGFSEYELRTIAQVAGYPVAIRMSATAPIKFDTAELQKYLEKRSRMVEMR